MEKRHRDQALRNFNIRKLGREGERTGKWEAKMVRENQGSVVSWQPQGECFKKERVVNHITVSTVLLKDHERYQQYLWF